MMQPSDTNNFADGQRPSAAPRQAATPRKVLRVPTLVTTIVVLSVLALAGYFWRAHKVRTMAAALKQRAEDLVAEKDLPTALTYYASYLKLHPDDVAARLRQAELYDQLAGNLKRTVELYQGALSALGIAPEQELPARRRLAELLLQGDQLAAAETEEKEARGPGAERVGPEARAVALARFEGDDPGGAVPAEGSGQAGDSQGSGRGLCGRPGPARQRQAAYYRDPMVYLTRYDYRSQQHLPGGSEDVAAAVKLAPTNPTVLFTAAAAAEAESHAAAAAGDRAKAMAAVIRACDFCERAIAAAPADPRGYQGLGGIYRSHGNVERAVGVWRRGLKAVKADSGRIAEPGPFPSPHRAGPLARSRRRDEGHRRLTGKNRCQGPLGRTQPRRSPDRQAPHRQRQIR